MLHVHHFLLGIEFNSIQLSLLSECQFSLNIFMVFQETNLDDIFGGHHVVFFQVFVNDFVLLVAPAGPDCEIPTTSLELPTTSLVVTTPGAPAQKVLPTLILFFTNI